MLVSRKVTAKTFIRGEAPWVISPLRKPVRCPLERRQINYTSSPVFYYSIRWLCLRLRFAAGEASANAAFAIACRDGAARRVTARRLTAHACRAMPLKLAAVTATVSAVAAAVTKWTISDTRDSTAKSVP